MAPPESDGSLVFTMSQCNVGRCWVEWAPPIFKAQSVHLRNIYIKLGGLIRDPGRTNLVGSAPTGHHSDRNMGFIRQSFSFISNHLLWILEYLGTATFFTRPRLHKSQALQCQVCRARNALGRSNSPVPMVHSSSARLVDYIVSYLYILMWVKQ